MLVSVEAQSPFSLDSLDIGLWRSGEQAVGLPVVSPIIAVAQPLGAQMFNVLF